jgi:hypothetical protein
VFRHWFKMVPAPHDLVEVALEMLLSEIVIYAEPW